MTAIAGAPGSPGMNLQDSAFEPLRLFLTHEKIPEPSWPVLIEITEEALPTQHQDTLTQPLLTNALAQHYAAAPTILPPLHVIDNIGEQRYYRAIHMIVNDKVVELGLIIVNTRALPDNFNKRLREAKTPFGTMLIDHGIQTLSPTKQFFKTRCDKHLAGFLTCEEGKLVYGRTNTIVRESDGVWLAHVVEILPG